MRVTAWYGNENSEGKSRDEKKYWYDGKETARELAKPCSHSPAPAGKAGGIPEAIKRSNGNVLRYFVCVPERMSAREKTRSLRKMFSFPRIVV